MRVLLSTGIGRLVFPRIAEALTAQGLEVEVVQGWVPSRRIPDRALDALGRLVGAPKLSRGMAARRMEFLDPARVHALPGADFLTQGLFVLNRAGLLSRGRAARLGWTVFGRGTRRVLGGQDIFHCRSGAGGGGAIEAARRRGIAVVVDHSIAHPAFMARSFERTGKRILIRPEDPFWKLVLDDCRRADLLVVNSHFVKETFLAEGFEESRIAVVYRGVRDDFRSLKTGYAAGEPLELLFTGQFGLRKGAPYLISALERLRREGLDFRLTVLGSTRESDHLIARSGVSGRIRAPGFIPQDRMKRYLANSDIYVFPSLAEGCANSGLEAMAAGLPVVTTRESGLPIEDGVNGTIIPARSADAIVEALRRLVGDREARARLGRAAAATVAENHSWSDYGRNVARLYRDLAPSGLAA